MFLDPGQRAFAVGVWISRDEYEVRHPDLMHVTLR
jgi:hypothetical protein